MNAPKIQRCADCDDPTGRCEDDSLYVDEGHAVCEDCYDLYPQCDCCGARCGAHLMTWHRVDVGECLATCPNCKP